MTSSICIFIRKLCTRWYALNCLWSIFHFKFENKDAVAWKHSNSVIYLSNCFIICQWSVILLILACRNCVRIHSLFRCHRSLYSEKCDVVLHEQTLLKSSMQEVDFVVSYMFYQLHKSISYSIPSLPRVISIHVITLLTAHLNTALVPFAEQLPSSSLYY